MGEPRWAKTFTRMNRPGAYLRVLEPGEVLAGDPVTVEDRPAHGVTIAQAFRASMTGRRARTRIGACCPCAGPPSATVGFDGRRQHCGRFP